MVDLWDAYGIHDDIRTVLETKKKKGENRWIITEGGTKALSTGPKPKRLFVQPTFLSLVLRPAATQPTSALASAPMPVAAAAAAPASPPSPPAATAVSTDLINLPIRGKRSRDDGNNLINLPIRGKRPRDDGNDSGSKDEPMRKVSKTTAAAVEEKE